MNPNENNENQQPEIPNQKRVIQPLNGEEVKAHLSENSIPAQVVQPQQASPPPQSTQNPIESNTGVQTMVGMSASQMGLGQPKNKLFDFEPKKLLIKGLLALVVLSVILVILVLTNIITLSEFKTISYINSKGNQYKVSFYSKHKTTALKSGNNQLVSKVSKDGKFPITFSISNGEVSGYNKVKDCSSFTKVFDVQNSNLNQKISVCDALKGKSDKAGVYIAGFMYNDQSHIITISQDLSGVDLSSQSGAQQSLTKFGIEPYKQDIENIISSIKVE